MLHEKNNGNAPGQSCNRADQLLIEECLAGNEAAWQQLNGRLLQRMQATAFRALGRGAANKALMEELAVDLVSTFFLNRRLLEALRATERSLDSFLDFLIYRAAKNYYRKTARRKRHEIHLSDAKLAEIGVMDLTADFLNELFEILTPAEREYMRWLENLNPDGGRPSRYGSCYARQLQHRILQKVRRLLNG